MGYAVDADTAVAVWLLAAGESGGKRDGRTYVGSFELSTEEEVGKYVGAPVGRAGGVVREEVCREVTRQADR